MTMVSSASAASQAFSRDQKLGLRKSDFSVTSAAGNIK
jgi:hypothetical protein